MKAGHNAIYFPVTLLVIVFCLFAEKAEARGVDSMRISGRVAVLSNSSSYRDTLKQRTYYGIFKNKKSAQKSVTALKAAIDRELVNMSELRDCLSDNGFKFQTKGDGRFNLIVYPGMVIAAVTSGGEISEVTDDNIIREGKTDYTIVINSSIVSTTVCEHCLKRGLPEITNMGIVGRVVHTADSIPEDESGMSRYYLLSRPFKFLDFTAGIPEMEFDYRFHELVYDDLVSESQAVQYYFAHKKEFMEGKQRFLGHDFFKLYNVISDSLELDTVTMIAYNYLVKPKRGNLRELYAESMAPYILNRMARMLLKAGIPDTTLLMPFIDEPATDTIFDKEIDAFRMTEEGYEVNINMQDILVTQAMNYLVLGKYDRAHKYREWMVAMSRRSRGALYALRMYMDFIGFFFDSGCLDGDRFLRGVDFVKNSSLLNKAVLMTEVPVWRSDFEETNDLIDMLDDDDPRKWYLKGVLWADDSYMREDPDLCAYRYPEQKDLRFKFLSDDELMKLMTTDFSAFDKYETEKEMFLERHEELHRGYPEGIRHYLAYFHHSFKLGGPMFRKCYFSEGRVPENLRAKYKYRKSDFAAYEELFKLLKVRDDENRAKLLGKEVIDNEMYMVSDAQAMRITGGINVVNTVSDKTDTIQCVVYYGLFKDMAEAEKVKKQVDSLQYKTMTSEDFRIACRHLGINKKTTKSGRFVTLAEPGMVILPVTENGNTVGIITDDNVVKADKTDYSIAIKTFYLREVKMRGEGCRIYDYVY